MSDKEPSNFPKVTNEKGFSPDSLYQEFLRGMGEMPGKYHFFTERVQRERLRTVGERTCGFVENNGVTQVAFVDLSARLGYLVFREAWKKRHHGDGRELPEIYFFNPLGFETEKTIERLDGELPRYFELAAKQLSPDKITALRGLMASNVQIGLIKGFILKELGGVRSSKLVEADFTTTYRNIRPFIRTENGTRQNKLLVIDTCIHSGSSLGPISEVLERVGFSHDNQNLFIGVVGNVRNYSNIKPDFVALDGKQDMGCYPFGLREESDKVLVKSTQSVRSSIVYDDDYALAMPGVIRQRNIEIFDDPNGGGKVRQIAGRRIRKEIVRVMASSD